MFVSLPDIKLNELSDFLDNILSQKSEIKISKQVFNLMSMSTIKHEVPPDDEDLGEEILGHDDDDVDGTDNEDINFLDSNYVPKVKAKISKKEDKPYLIPFKPKDFPDTKVSVEYSDLAASNIKKSNKKSKTRHRNRQQEKLTLQRSKSELKCSKSSLDPKFRCTICGKGFHRNNNLARHILVHNRQPHQCSECDRKFKTEVILKKHMATSHSNQSGRCVVENGVTKYMYKCSVCDFQTTKKSNLKRHNETQHVRTVENGYHKCPDCRAIMPQEEVDAHSCVFYSCDICGKQFGTIQLVQAHTRVVHEEVGVHSCEMCGKIFERSILLKNHIENQHSEKVSCHICGAKFSSYTMKKHLQSHVDKVICKICNKEVRQLKRHMETSHTPDDQKAHQCPDCGKGFGDMYRLKKHQMNMHLKLRPYKCRYGCTFAYNDNSNRNAHEKKTHGKLFDGTVEN